MRTHVRVVELDRRRRRDGRPRRSRTPGRTSTRGERVLARESSRARAPSARWRIGSALSFWPLSSIASPTICARFCAASGTTQLHLAELGDHLEATDLAVHLARARQCLEIVGMQLPRTLIQTERAFALGDHILDERCELEQSLGLFGLACPTLRAPSRARRSFASSRATGAGVPEAAYAYPSAVYPPAFTKETTPLILRRIFITARERFGAPDTPKALGIRWLPGRRIHRMPS